MGFRESAQTASSVLSFGMDIGIIDRGDVILLRPISEIGRRWMLANLEGVTEPSNEALIERSGLSDLRTRIEAAGLQLASPQ